MAQVMLKGPAAALDPASDEAVVEDVCAGDVARFEILMRRHNQRLFRTARAILRDDAEAEDVVQQAYLSAYAKLDQFRGESRFSTWLTRITVHEALRRMRRHGRLADLDVIEAADDAAASGPSRTPEEHAARGELRALLEQAIDSLPESYRVVFVMRDIEELDTRETAECLELSEEAVRVRLHRARKALREWLYERADALTAEAFSFAGDRCDRIVRYVLSRILA
ncbi:MAG TPA: RNA polymerase sigma factor [Sandaracinaceae bacterium]